MEYQSRDLEFGSGDQRGPMIDRLPSRLLVKCGVALKRVKHYHTFAMKKKKCYIEKEIDVHVHWLGVAVLHCTYTYKYIYAQKKK